MATLIKIWNILTRLDDFWLFYCLQLIWKFCRQKSPQRMLQFKAISLQAPQIVCLEGNSGWRKMILALDSWDAHSRNNFSESRLLHLLIQRKALKSLTWNVWVLLLAVIFQCYTTFFSPQQHTPIYPGFPAPLTSLEQFLRATQARVVRQALSKT